MFNQMFDIKVYQPGNRILSSMEAVALATWVSESLDSGAKYLALDLQNVSFMDSRGLGALVLVHNRASKAGATLGLCALSGQAGMLLDLTEMRNQFQIYSSVLQFKEAIANNVDSACATTPTHPH